MMMTRFNKGSNYWFSVLFAVIILIMGGVGSASASGVTVFHESFDVADLKNWDGVGWDDWNEKENLWQTTLGNPEVKGGRLHLKGAGAGIGQIDTSSGASGTLIVNMNNAKDSWTVYIGEGDLFSADDLVLSGNIGEKGRFTYSLPEEYFIPNLAIRVASELGNQKAQVEYVTVIIDPDYVRPIPKVNLVPADPDIIVSGGTREITLSAYQLLDAGVTTSMIQEDFPKFDFSIVSGGGTLKPPVFIRRTQALDFNHVDITYVSGTTAGNVIIQVEESISGSTDINARIDTSTIHVQPGALTSGIIVSATTNLVSMNIGESEAFTALGVDRHGNYISGVTGDWTIVSGTTTTGKTYELDDLKLVELESGATVYGSGVTFLATTGDASGVSTHLVVTMRDIASGNVASGVTSDPFDVINPYGNLIDITLYGMNRLFFEGFGSVKGVFDGSAGSSGSDESWIVSGSATKIERGTGKGIDGTTGLEIKDSIGPVYFRTVDEIDVYDDDLPAGTGGKDTIVEFYNVRNDHTIQITQFAINNVTIIDTEEGDLPTEVVNGWDRYEYRFISTEDIRLQFVADAPSGNNTFDSIGVYTLEDMGQPEFQADGFNHFGAEDIQFVAYAEFSGVSETEVTTWATWNSSVTEMPDNTSGETIVMDFVKGSLKEEGLFDTQSLPRSISTELTVSLEESGVNESSSVMLNVPKDPFCVEAVNKISGCFIVTAAASGISLVGSYLIAGLGGLGLFLLVRRNRK